ncbi:MAG TPA: hypothetical protein EYG57_21285 [Planctomycetes bacterium]|nr:hypothetical protein [Planctomycetaceae bacterium]HIM32070.1 hypothetical protein [Planctomycetota bacterium]
MAATIPISSLLELSERSLSQQELSGAGIEDEVMIAIPLTLVRLARTKRYADRGCHDCRCILVSLNPIVNCQRYGKIAPSRLDIEYQVPLGIHVGDPLR